MEEEFKGEKPQQVTSAPSLMAEVTGFVANLAVGGGMPLSQMAHLGSVRSMREEPITNPQVVTIVTNTLTNTGNNPVGKHEGACPKPKQRENVGKHYNPKCTNKFEC
jgi:hypothetical protein